MVQENSKFGKLRIIYVELVRSTLQMSVLYRKQFPNHFLAKY